MNICKGLNEYQEQAVKVQTNAVVAAGAGSGKTKVLASRYVYLITEKNYRIENILALTFTEKAAAEMHQRIYGEFQKMRDGTDDAVQRERAEQALDSFFKAQIMTLDAFCHKIAVTACRRFGISPDFTISVPESKRLAYNLSLDFFLEHRADPCLQYLLDNKSITDFLDDFFVKILVQYTTVSRPVDFEAALQKQLAAALSLFLQLKTEADQITESIASYLHIEDNFIKAVKAVYQEMPEPPASLDDPALDPFLVFLKKLAAVNQSSGSGKIAEVPACKEQCKALREIVPQLMSIFYFYSHKEDIRKIYALCTELQARYITEKKRRSIMHFGDIAQLAVDALITDPELRLFYKRQTHRIMIDEFQDNNSLQRDLLFLLAEKEERNARSVPHAEELEPDKLFFVGDEKQSIYAFRGADVAVFRTLSRELGTEKDSGASSQESGCSINLQTNYRTEPALLEFFNEVFMQVFYSEKHRPAAGTVPDYEAEFIPILSRDAAVGLEPQVDILFADKVRFEELTGLDNDEDEVCAETKEDSTAGILHPVECEAYALAKKIAALHEAQTPVYDKDTQTVRPCRWSDFAVLLRASTRQAVYERFFRLFKIPSVSVQQKGLFQDAPLNDLCALLRLAVYPHDRSVYAQVLRSPFVRMNGRSFTLLLLRGGLPFDAAAADELEPAERQPFLNACALFERVRGYVKTGSNAELITALWYDEGYRYVLLTETAYHRYLELYDYLFALAVESDAAGMNLSAFIDSVVAYIHGEEKIEDMEIPLEHGGDAVKIMTVHKSKGLEFPIVCIPDCGNTGNLEKKDGMVFLHKELGPVLHLPQDSLSGGIFFEQLRAEANAKLLAETKRLLYVALTRAQVRLVLSGVQQTACKPENMPEEPRSLDAIKMNLVQPEKAENNRSFFQLLLPALPDNNPCLHFEELLPMSVSVLRRTEVAAAPSDSARVLEHYRNTCVKHFPLAEPRVIPATQFEKDRQWLAASGEGTETPADTESAALSASGSSPEDELSSGEFGTLVHKAIEARFLDRPFAVPPKYTKEVHTLCTSFFSSPIGQMAEAADFKKMEYGFLTLYGGKLVTGQIDLLFEYEDTVYVIDYKTDKKMHPDHHRKQLLIYKAAVENLYRMDSFGSESERPEFPKAVKAYIFYLRTQTAVEVV